jgi:hypothetical protein
MGSRPKPLRKNLLLVVLRLLAQHLANVARGLRAVAGRSSGQFGGLSRASAGQGLVEGGIGLAWIFRRLLISV